MLPDRLIYQTQAAGGKGAYLYQLGRLLTNRKSFDGVICGHLHLLPLAAFAAHDPRPVERGRTL